MSAGSVMVQFESDKPRVGIVMLHLQGQTVTTSPSPNPFVLALVRAGDAGWVAVREMDLS